LPSSARSLGSDAHPAAVGRRARDKIAATPAASPTSPLLLKPMTKQIPPHPQSGILYPVVVRFETQNYAGTTTNNFGLEEVKQL